VAERLRWTSDFLVLASKAIAIVACVRGSTTRRTCTEPLSGTFGLGRRTWTSIQGSPPTSSWPV